MGKCGWGTQRPPVPWRQNSYLRQHNLLAYGWRITLVLIKHIEKDFSQLQLKNICVTINRTTSSVSLFIGHMVEQHDSLVDNLQKVAKF